MCRGPGQSRAPAAESSAAAGWNRTSRVFSGWSVKPYLLESAWARPP